MEAGAFRSARLGKGLPRRTRRGRVARGGVIEAPDAATFVIRGMAIMELTRPTRVARVGVFRAGDLRAPMSYPRSKCDN